MSKATLRRESQREALIEAAERRITLHSVAGLKARDLAEDIGVALGAIYNLVADMDELVLRVISRTLARLDGALSEGEAGTRTSTEAVDRLVVIATRYHAFAAGNLNIWRVMFEYRAPDRALPEWAAADQVRLFRHIIGPLGVLMPEASLPQREVMARTLFAAVHGIIALGLDEKLVAVPLEVLDRQLEWLVRSACTEAALQRGATA